MDSVFNNLYGFCILRRLQVFKKDLQIGLLTKVTNPRRLVFGQSVRIGFNCWLNMADGYNGTIVLNDEVSIGARAFITCAAGISIGSGTVISTDVFITDHDHDFYHPSSSIRYSGLRLSTGTNIGENCFIGTKSCIWSANRG
jgi:acetyltransferase-like isoleucine patch superfamily enzyme